jgi:hypothetical protein
MSYKRPKKIKKIKTSQSQTVGVKMPLSVVHLIWNHPSVGNFVWVKQLLNFRGQKRKNKPSEPKNGF